jgi:hypothetical protein
MGREPQGSRGPLQARLREILEEGCPFKRNDTILEEMPAGVVHFPGGGIQDNLADKARKLGIPVWKQGGA